MTTNSVGKILVVDDEFELKTILVEALASQGYETAGFTSGEEALVLLRDQPFDILLTDLMMPGMDGITLVRESVQIDPNLICIMMTGQGTIQTAIDAMKVGAFDYVLKPFRLQSILPVLTRAMNTRHLRLENVQLREAVAIHELSETIAFTLDPQTVLSKLADAALQQSEADEVSVLLPTVDGDDFYVAAVRGEKRERLLGERIPAGQSISSWVARQREAVILNGEVDDERFVALWPRPDIRSSVSIPMVVAKKLVGVLNLNVVDRPRPFTLGQMKALTILAGTAAAALESASLYAQVLEAERNYRSIFENAVDGIFRATPDAARFTSVNPFMAQMFGYDSPQEMVEAVTDMTEQLGLDPARRDEALELLRKHGVVEKFETHVRRKDGSEIWTSENVRAIRNADGEIAYLDGIVSDITERKHAEDALRASEAEMRALFASMTDVIIVFDAEGRHLKIAPTKTPHLYRPAAERIGKTIHEIFPKEKADLFLAQIREALAKGRTHRVEYNLSIDGREFWYDASISPMTRNSVIWVARDITERKQAEEERAHLAAEIENQRHRLDNIISSVPGVVWEAWGEPDAATQRINFVSHFVEKMLGYGVEEWLSTPNFWLQIVHQDDRERTAKAAVADFVGGQSINTLEFRWVAKDGRTVWVESTSVVIKDKEDRPLGVRGVTLDISERKRAEAELRFQKTLLESQSEASIDGILVTSDNREIVSFNQRFVELWGIPPAILGGRSDEAALQSVIDKLEDPEEFLKGVDYLYNHPEENSRDEIQLKDGRTFDRYTTPIKSEQREYYGRVWFFRDITDRKRAETELRESEERYRDLVENAQDIIYSHDLKGHYTSSNRAGEEITGYTLAESLKLNLAETVAPEYVAKAREMLARKLAGENVTAYELELIAKDGHRVPVEVNTRLVLENGVAVGVTGIARDITERKRAEAELRRLAAAVEETADSIVITDKDGNIQYVNPAFERITGYARDEVLGQNPRILKSGKTDPSVYKELWESITRGDVWSGHLTNRRKDGTLFEERVTISAIYNESHEIVNYVAVKQDVSDLVQLEEQLRQSQKMEAIGQLAGGVAHDFNNLLTAINGYSALALQRLEDGHPIKSYLEEVKKAGDRATNLTRQLLAFGRKQIMQPLALDLNGVVSDMNKMLRRLIGEDIALTAKLNSDIGKVMADPGQIEQVLVNLIVNARDAMPRGGNLTIETENVELDAEYGGKHMGVAPGKYVLLAVSDTGEGMSEEVQRRIFEPFFTTKEKGKGTGLGLSTVYGIVKQSGGNIWVYSEPGEGTTFKVYLPRVESKTHDPGKTVIEAAPLGGSETILLVEDEDVVRSLARRILEQAGYSVVAASRGDEALRFCEEHAAEVDLLLTDVVMPEMSGKELADQLKLQSPELKMLFMSGYADESIVHHGVLDSSVEFIQKPFTPTALVKKVREVLDAHELISK